MLIMAKEVQPMQWTEIGSSNIPVEIGIIRRTEYNELLEYKRKYLELESNEKTSVLRKEYEKLLQYKAGYLDLESKIAAFYENDENEDDDDDGGSLIEIGEIAANHFGYF